MREFTRLIQHLKKNTLGKSKYAHLLDWRLFVDLILTSLGRLKDVQ